MSYTALYRKFRPDNFDDVKGQDHIVTTLTNQIKANRIGHAYLFCGTRGTGKTTVAKILAKAVNCQHPVNGSPCGECDMCKAIQAGTSMNVIEIDAASNNGVDNIREIREEVAYRPTEGNYKVYIIDEVHMLSTGAFNALLKTLEEPPSYVIFILATTEAYKIPITILSRCQRYDFHRITIDTIAARLDELLKIEGVEAEEKAVRYVAKAGDGSMRDALSLLDQCAAFHFGETLTYEHVLDVLGAVDNSVFRDLFHAIRENRTKDCILKLEEMVVQGRELSQFVIDFIWFLRNLLLLKTADDAEDLLDMSEDNLTQLREDAALVDENTLMRYIRVFSELSNQIRFANQKRVLIELAFIKLTKPEMEQSMDSVLERLEKLEQRLNEEIVGQSRAVAAVAGAIRRSRTGLGEPGRPIGAMLFLGPTGVGKTALARALAVSWFGSEKALLKFDMSEYQEQHTTARLLGAPPGYLGHDEGGQLTEAVRRRPYSVVLFDEIEKAHPDIQNILLQILEDGQLTDAMGRKADFRNTIVLLTSNLGARFLAGQSAPLGFAAGSEAVFEKQSAQAVEEAKKWFRPELAGRLDEMIVFRPLADDSLCAIAEKLLCQLEQRAAGSGYQLHHTPQVGRALAAKARSAYGARELRRAVDRAVEQALADRIASGTASTGQHWTADCSADGSIILREDETVTM